MNFLAREFYTPGGEGAFEEVFLLSEDRSASWEKIVSLSSEIPRGWFELSRLSPQERCEFVSDFWLDALPYHPSSHPAVADFFEKIGDISILLYRKKERWHAETVYSLSDESTFFRGRPPLDEGSIQEFQGEFREIFPRDYLSFLKIHNGFGKLSTLGIFPIDHLLYAKERVKSILLKAGAPIHWEGRLVDPSSFYPFYEEEGLGSFRCFYADWQGDLGMGNLFLSGIDETLSSPCDSFSLFLIDYLHGVGGE